MRPPPWQVRRAFLRRKCRELGSCAVAQGHRRERGAVEPEHHVVVIAPMAGVAIEKIFDVTVLLPGQRAGNTYSTDVVARVLQQHLERLVRELAPVRVQMASRQKGSGGSGSL